MKCQVCRRVVHYSRIHITFVDSETGEPSILRVCIQCYPVCMEKIQEWINQAGQPKSALPDPCKTHQFTRQQIDDALNTINGRHDT